MVEFCILEWKSITRWEKATRHHPATHRRQHNKRTLSACKSLSWRRGRDCVSLSAVFSFVQKCGGAIWFFRPSFTKFHLHWAASSNKAIMSSKTIVCFNFFSDEIHVYIYFVLASNYSLKVWVPQKKKLYSKLARSYSSTQFWGFNVTRRLEKRKRTFSCFLIFESDFCAP